MVLHMGKTFWQYLQNIHHQWVDWDYQIAFGTSWISFIVLFVLLFRCYSILYVFDKYFGISFICSTSLDLSTNAIYSRGGISGNACFVSFCGICVCILISGVLHVMPYVWQCQNFWNLKNPSLTAKIITILVRTTISELYQFFSPDSCCKVWPWPEPFFCPQGPRSLVYRPLLVLWHGGQAPQGLQVMCVESGTLGQG